jgi:hypothetical protein
MAAAPRGPVRPRGPSHPHRDDLIGQVRAVLVQPPAQHRQDRHAAAYASDGVQGECTATACKVERLRHENAIIRSSARLPLEQDHEL